MPTAHDIRPTGRRPIEWRDEQVLSYVECSLSPDARLRTLPPRTRKPNAIRRLLGI